MNKKLTMVAFGAIAVGSAICATDAHAADEDLVLKSDNNGAISEQDVATKKQEYKKAQDNVKKAKSELDTKVQKAKDVEKQAQAVDKKIQDASDADQKIKQQEQKNLDAKQSALKQAQKKEKEKEKALADKQNQKDVAKKEESEITKKVTNLVNQKRDTQPLTTKEK